MGQMVLLPVDLEDDPSAVAASARSKRSVPRPKATRQIQVSFRLWELRDRAKEKLLSEQGTVLRTQRSIDVETVFGRIMQNWGFRSFLLRGLEKVKAEWGLLCIVHNFAKLAVA